MPRCGVGGFACLRMVCRAKPDLDVDVSPAATQRLPFAGGATGIEGVNISDTAGMS